VNGKTITNLPAPKTAEESIVSRGQSKPDEDQSDETATAFDPSDLFARKVTEMPAESRK
jgi:hypothetical protein